MLTRTVLNISVVVLLLGATGINSAQAQQKTLLWKFKPKQKLHVSFGQTITVDTIRKNAFSEKSADVMMEMDWIIKSVDGKGKTEVAMTITRVRMKIETPTEEVIEYDSDVGIAPNDEAQKISDVIRPLLQTEFEGTLTNWGEIHASDLCKAAAVAFRKAAKGKSKLHMNYNKSNLDEILEQPAFVLPTTQYQKIRRWNFSKSIPTPMGKVQQDSVYRFLGLTRRDDRVLEYIGLSVKLRISNTTKADRKGNKIKAKSLTGRAYYDKDSRQLAETIVGRHLVTEVTSRKGVARTTTDSMLKLTFLKEPEQQQFPQQRIQKQRIQQ